MPKNTLKMRFGVCTTLLMCNPRIMRDSCVLQVAHAYIRGFLLCKLAYHARVVLLHSCECVPRPLKHKNIPFELVWVVMQLTPSVVTTLSSPLSLLSI